LAQRLDKWLVYARFVKHRSLASNLIENGKIRINHERVLKCSHALKHSDVITMTLGERIIVVRVIGEAKKRGPASDARQLYEDMTASEKPDATGMALC
jgi:ribosome-associated heat shock protein Hsp15